MRWFAVFAATWCVGCAGTVPAAPSVPTAEPGPAAALPPVESLTKPLSELMVEPPIEPAVEPPDSPFEKRLRRVRRTALDPIARIRALAQEEASHERRGWLGPLSAPSTARVVAKLADRVAIEFDSAAQARAVVAACYYNQHKYKGEILLQERDGAIWFGRAVPYRPDLPLRFGDRALGVRIRSR